MNSGAAVRIFPLEYENSQEITSDGDIFLCCSCFPVNFAKFFGAAFFIAPPSDCFCRLYYSN